MHPRQPFLSKSGGNHSPWHGTEEPNVERSTGSRSAREIEVRLEVQSPRPRELNRKENVMNPRLFVLALCLLTLPAATVALSQTNQDQSNQAQPDQSQPNQDQRAQPTARSTERIIKEVRHELLMLPYFTVFDNIAYKVDGFTVTLLGQVTRPVTKSDAENAVKHIEGVDHVDDQIEVLPPSPMDDRLRQRLFRTIYGYPALQRYALGVQKPIRIIVKNGHVTLEGVVDSEGDKNLAGIRANGVSGIFSVDNNLQVSK
jgi:hyperosmotically inducible protein